MDLRSFIRRRRRRRRQRSPHCWLLHSSAYRSIFGSFVLTGLSDCACHITYHVSGRIVPFQVQAREQWRLVLLC